MKRAAKSSLATPVWPQKIVEISSSAPDARTADPNSTQKISREELEAVLQRTKKSGTRRAVRDSEIRDTQTSLPGPRDDDDSPQITITRIDSMEIEAIDPTSLPIPRHNPITPSHASPLAQMIATPGRVHAPVRRRVATRVSPRAAFLAGVGVAVFALCLALLFVGLVFGRL